MSAAFDAPRHVMAAKFVIAGGFGVGKTTFVGAISEIDPLQTEAAMTTVSRGVDDHGAVEEKSTTTVAMDFGRLTVDETLVMYLFGAPGQDRFRFMWDDLVTGALGAVVLVDTRRLADSFASIDYFEQRGLPFVIGVNRFPGTEYHRLVDVVGALGVGPEVPVMDCDARVRASARDVILALLEMLVARLVPSR